MIALLNFIIILLLITIPLYLIINLRKLKVDFFINAKYWLIGYGYFYILIPSYFLEKTNHIQNWNFTNSTIILSKLGGIYFISVILLISLFIIKNKEIEITKNLKLKKTTSIIISVFWWVILLYAMFASYKVSITLLSMKGVDRFILGNVFEELVSVYKLKSLLFISLTISTIKFWEKNKFYYFIPLLIISYGDIMAGGRTLAFFSIIAIYLNLVFKSKKLYISKVVILLVWLLASVTSSRMSVQSIDTTMSESMNFIYQSLGEFVQTFNSFSFSIQYNFISNNPLIESVINIFQGILPGFIKLKLGLIEYSPGNMLAAEVGRGYGLGFNILTEAFYYGGWILFLVYPFIITLVVTKIGNLLLKLKFPGFICFLFLIIYLRLFFREGVTTYILIPLYLFLIYGSISLIWKNSDVLRMKVRGWRSIQNEKTKDLY